MGPSSPMRVAGHLDLRCQSVVPNRTQSVANPPGSRRRPAGIHPATPRTLPPRAKATMMALWAKGAEVIRCQRSSDHNHFPNLICPGVGAGGATHLPPSRWLPPNIGAPGFPGLPGCAWAPRASCAPRAAWSEERGGTPKPPGPGGPSPCPPGKFGNLGSPAPEFIRLPGSPFTPPAAHNMAGPRRPLAPIGARDEGHSSCVDLELQGSYSHLLHPELTRTLPWGEKWNTLSGRKR